MEYRQSKDTGGLEPTRSYSKKQEKKVAFDVKGKATPNSGATTHIKGDVVNDLFTIECKTKTTDSDSISIKKEWLRKLKDESRYNHTEYEALVFNFGPNSPNYVIIDMSLFQSLQEYLEEDRE